MLKLLLAWLASLPLLSSSLTCEDAAQLGRVRCVVHATVPEGYQLAFADMVVEAVPLFAVALKERLSTREADIATPRDIRWSLALAAKAAGLGRFSVRVRATVCNRENACETQSQIAAVELRVGSPKSGPALAK